MNEIIQTLSVLVVDDVGSARRVLRRFLQSMGVTTIVEAATGREAEAAMAARKFDLVISDLNLGDTTGLELFKTLRDKGNDFSSLLVTSEQDAAVLAQISSSASTNLLLKPFNLEGLRMKLILALSDKS